MATDTRFETDRLILRVFEPRDLDDIHEQVYADPEVCKWYCGATRTPEESRDWLHFRITEARYSEFHAFAVELKQTGRVIGLVRLGPWARVTRFPEEVDTLFNPIDVELSFAFGRAYWGQGYAAEACRPVIDYAFDELRLPRLVGGALAVNERSIALHRRLGYRVDFDPTDGDVVAMLVNTRPPKPAAPGADPPPLAPQSPQLSPH
jgi:RimJ/RimL family protein N-acetyltransferase